MEKPFEVRAFELPPIGTNAYLVSKKSEKKAVLFDAPIGVAEAIEPVLEESGCELESVFLTHGHWDHILGMAELPTANLSIFAHPGDRTLFESPESMIDYLVPGVSKDSLSPVPVSHWLEDGQILEVLGKLTEVRHVPGHSPGSVVFWVRDLRIAVCGDVIFNHGVGRTDLPGGSFQALESSIRSKIYTLPAETELLPGHGPTTRVSMEMKGNPFVPALD